MHEGCQKNNGNEIIEIVDLEKERKIYNQLRSVMITLYRNSKDKGIFLTFHLL